MYFRQFWRDPRLSFERRAGLEKLVVGAEYIKLIWVPDTFFVNEKTAYFHDATTDNQFLRILHTGEILRSIRYEATVCTEITTTVLGRIFKQNKLEHRQSGDNENSFIDREHQRCSSSGQLFLHKAQLT